MQNNIGTLYVVATPIGNLEDMTLRAIDVLKKVDRIATEDTRHSGPLLNHFSIDKPTISMHDFNERERMAVIIDYIFQGESIAIISDAGTPLISDPGFHLIREAQKQGIKIEPIPGACAAIAALSVGGLPTDRFTFEGFLPAKDETRRNRLARLGHEIRTMVFYEAPHRLLATLQSMKEIFGEERQVVIARELTKLHESVFSGALGEIILHCSSDPNTQRGELVILVAGSNEEERETREVVTEEVLDTLLAELTLKQAVSLASKITGERKNTLYELALKKAER